MSMYHSIFIVLIPILIDNDSTEFQYHLFYVNCRDSSVSSAVKQSSKVVVTTAITVEVDYEELKTGMMDLFETY